MATMTMTFDLPETQDIDLVALKKQMQAFFKMIISMPNVHKENVDAEYVKASLATAFEELKTVKRTSKKLDTLDEFLSTLQ